MARTRGYAPKGERLIADAPHGHWQTTTFVGALRADGFVAPLVLDGAINGEWFRAYVERVLVPALRRGDVVVMDNLGSHKVAGVRKAIEGAGCELLYLPPYRPDLNPIENAFSSSGCCAPPPSGPSRSCGTGSGNCSTNSSPTSAGTTSGSADTPTTSHKLEERSNCDDAPRFGGLADDASAL